MISLKRYNTDNKSTGEEKVSETIFKAEWRPSLLHDYVVMQRRAHRQGTASTKTRAEVSGTGKKPFKQKGTGHARQGTLIGPHQPGGGIAFGPKPRTYYSNLNKKSRRAALCLALSQKNFESKLGILDDFEIKSGKSKDAYKVLSKFSKKSTLLIGDVSDVTLRSVRNIENCKVLKVAGLNVLDILKHDFVLILRSSLAALNERLESKEAA